MLRIAVYARVSTSDKGQDPENQLRELRQFVANKAAEGWHPDLERVTEIRLTFPTAPAEAVWTWSSLELVHDAGDAFHAAPAAWRACSTLCLLVVQMRSADRP